MIEVAKTNKKIVDLINQSTWTFSKTMPKWPHYYIVRNKENENDFVELVKLIRKEETTIINRCKVLKP